jgi:drug/metabolite transporter (DMT)-like permease
LFAYLVFFSFAYVRLSAGTGALILIVAVQLTMFSVALREGDKFSLLSWVGLGTATLGLIYLVLPGVSAPDLLAATLMAVSGAAWGLFTLFARGANHPVEANASNLLCCVVPAALVNLMWFSDFNATLRGATLAVASGAIATGLGYIAWYLAVSCLRGTHAATVQLSMPILVALGGVVFLAEPLSLRLLIASAAMLGGIAIVLAQRDSTAHYVSDHLQRKGLRRTC